MLLYSHPALAGEVWELTIHPRDLILSYPPWWDAHEVSYRVSAQLFGGDSLSAVGRFMAVGHVSGDITGDGQVDISDVTELVAYMFGGAPAPTMIEAGDVDGDTKITISDLVYLVQYLFAGGPPPQHRP